MKKRHEMAQLHLNLELVAAANLAAPEIQRIFIEEG